MTPVLETVVKKVAFLFTFIIFSLFKNLTGPKVFELALQLLSTLVILAFIKLRLSIDIPLSFPLGKKREVFLSVHFCFSVSERIIFKRISLRVLKNERVKFRISR